MHDLEPLRERLRAFVAERDWDPFHTPKDLSIALSIEASELLETFLWKGAGECDVEKVKEELADVLIYALLLANKLDLDVGQIIADKIEVNRRKYPVETSKGSSRKHKAP